MILIVDDEKAVAGFLSELLEKRGYKVQVETDSNQALSTYLRNPSSYRLIITDQTMPGMTGMELAQAVLNQDPNVPIILCTGYSDTLNQQQALNLGIKKFMTKPMQLGEIMSSVENLLGVVEK